MTLCLYDLDLALMSEELPDPKFPGDTEYKKNSPAQYTT